MSAVFEIITGKDSSYSLGIRVRIGELEHICPITESVDYEKLKIRIGSLTEELNGMLKKLERINNGSSHAEGDSAFDPDAAPEELWAVISTFADNVQLIESFNSLDEDKRRELADYIFANCNMFTGKGAFFSAQYAQETALLSV